MIEYEWFLGVSTKNMKYFEKFPQRMSNFVPNFRKMAYTGRFGQSDDYRREELIRMIEHSVEKLTLQELEALYYDMATRNYINEQY